MTVSAVKSKVLADPAAGAQLPDKVEAAERCFPFPAFVPNIRLFKDAVLITLSKI